MKEIIGLVYNREIEPGLMVELLPVTLWLENAVGYSTNRCAAACATLQHAYATMGITARTVAVYLVVANKRTGQRTLYGNPGAVRRRRHRAVHAARAAAAATGHPNR